MNVIVTEDIAWVIEIEGQPSVVEVNDDISVIGVAEQGPPGTPGDVYYIHNQSVPSLIWSVTHNMGKMPSVTVVDSAGTEVEGDVNYIDTNSLNIEFGASFSGKAFLN